MTEDDKKLLDSFDGKVRHIAFLYERLKEENASLKKLVADKDQTIENIRLSKNELEEKYRNLKMARMISINDGEIRDTKKELSDLVREVDKCIALLNE